MRALGQRDGETWHRLPGGSKTSAKVAAALKIAEQAIQENARSLRLARTARSKPGIDWGVDLSAGLCTAREPNMLMISRNYPSDLGEILAHTAWYCHHAGDDAEAVERLRDALHFGEVVETAPHILGLLAAEGTTSAMSKAIGLLAHDMRVADEPSVPNGAARRADVSALIAELLDEDLGRRYLSFDRLRRAQALDYWRIQLAGNARSRKSPESWLERVLLRPAALLDMVRLLDTYEIGISAFEEPLAIHRGVPEVERLPLEPKLLAALRRQFSYRHERTLLMSVEPAPRNESCVKAIAWRRIMATRLALRLYELDHETNAALLANLVPKYLPAVPLDPYFADGREVAFSCERTRWVLRAGYEEGVWQSESNPWPCQMWLSSH